MLQNQLLELVEPVLELVEPVLEPVEPVLEPVEPVLEPVEPAIELILEPVNSVSQPRQTDVEVGQLQDDDCRYDYATDSDSDHRSECELDKQALPLYVSLDRHQSSVSDFAGVAGDGAICHDFLR